MGRQRFQLYLATLVLAVGSVSSECPFISGQQANEDPSIIGGGRNLRALGSGYDFTGNDESYVSRPDWSEKMYGNLKADITKMLTDSREFWPADYGNYGPLMIRLAWHCSGSYRQSDGRGGCDGGRIRYNPERSWADNTNLDKALTLLLPIKLKYGSAVSWGDLCILAGNVAISSMGGPVLGFCAGRQDDSSGYDSLELGPTAEQEMVAPCEEDGKCEWPLGTTTLGLIYVNPSGPEGNNYPMESAKQIREVFGRMGFNDRETVALIGGGHAFGKAHGACKTGPGPDPTEAPDAPWPGTCGKKDTPQFGVGKNTFTSGYEGKWTETPTKWSNFFFVALLKYDWETYTSPGGNVQWRPVPKAGGGEEHSEKKMNKNEDKHYDKVPKIIMLTTDIALINDEAYKAIVTEFADHQQALDDAFQYAWYKLTTRDMGPRSRCAGPDVPDAQKFQLPLPEASPEMVDPDSYMKARKEIREIMSTSACTRPASSEHCIDPDMTDGQPSYAAMFVELAWQCASTFRSTDYMGGCNGARIRFSPQKDWESSLNMDMVLGLLDRVKDKFPEISYADLIVLAGTVALSEAGNINPPFCKGRVDAEEGDQLLSVLEPREYENVIVGVRDKMKIMGLSVPKWVALAARPRSVNLRKRCGYTGSYTKDCTTLSNEYFKILLKEKWDEVPDSEGPEYCAVGKEHICLTAEDLALLWDPEFKAQCVIYAENNELFLKNFERAWTAVMNADRFDGPTGNLCDDQKRMW